MLNWNRRLLAAVLSLTLIVGLLAATPAGFGQAADMPPGFGQDLFQVHLAPAAFDPLEALPAVHDSLDLAKYEEHERGLYVVQWKGPVYSAQKQAVAATGAELGEYLPHFSFLARMTEAERQLVADLPFIRSVVLYKPAFKLSPELLGPEGQVVSSFLDSETVTVQVAGFDSFASLRSAVSAVGGTVLQEQGSLVIAELPLANVADLARSTAVTSIAPVPKFQLFNDKAAGIIGADAALATGLDGAGQTVGVADTGLDTGRTDTMHQDLRGRVTHIFALGRPGDGSDTHGHGTHVAGSIAGNGAASNGQIKGMAPAARIVFQSVMDARGSLSGIGDVGTLLKQAYDAGARIHSNSWGDPSANGVYDASSQQLDRFVWQNRDMTVLMAAGNSGANSAGQTQYGTVSTPGTAKNAITIGASENMRPDRGGYADRPTDIAAFSSRGWTRDNRVKPDLVAPGTWILSLKSSRASDSNFWAPYNANYAFMGGTSMATPIAAGTVAQLRQYYTDHLGVRNPSAALLKATLINAATDLGHGLPSRDQGWGRINLAPLADAVKAQQPGWQFEDEAHALATGQTKSYNIQVSGNEPLRVTLVWTDYPASANAAKALVNDLDLTVTSPSGRTYYGNDFTNRGTADHANNVENVFIANPEAGTWTVEVHAFSVPSGPQNYALVYAGGAPGGTTPQPPVDSEAPTVRITAPAAGEVVKGQVPVQVQASDNVGVTKVELLADGNVVGETASAPYAFTWNSTTVADGRHELTARAYDAAGNAATSAAVAVTVANGATGPQPDPEPDPDPEPEPEPGRVEKSVTDTVGWFLSRYYALDVPVAGRVDLSLTWTGATDLDLYAMDGNGRLLGQATSSSGPSEQLSFTATQPGRYYVRVQSYYGQTQFRLTASYPAPGQPGGPGDPGQPGDPGTPGGSKTEERSGQLRANQRLDVPVRLTETGSLQAELTWSGLSYWGEPSLLVYDARSGRHMATATGRGSPKTLTLSQLPAGNYYVRVQASLTPIAYNLKVTTSH